MEPTVPDQPDSAPRDADAVIPGEVMLPPGGPQPAMGGDLDSGFDPADLLGGLGLGGPGGLDLGGLLDMAGQMQQHLAEAQEQAASTVLEGVAGGGVVKVTVTGGGDFQSVTISPEAVDPDDVEMLQDLVLAALNDAMAQVHELQSGTFGEPGGLDLGGLLGGLG